MAGGAQRIPSLLMAARRRRAKPAPLDPNLLESDQLDGHEWPTLKATWAGLSDAEIELRHQRARQLVEGGWDAVEW